MSAYVSFSDLQEELTSHYLKTGEKIQFQDAVQFLIRKEKYLTQADNTFSPEILLINDQDFEDFVDQLYLPVPPRLANIERVEESGMFPLHQDVFVFRHPRDTRPLMHSHDFWEIECVLSGTCRLYFEDEIHILEKGTVFLIAPGSRHEVEVIDKGCVYCIMLRKSTFEANFFYLLSRDDALSLFFRTNLNEDRGPNYLMFHAGDEPGITLSVRHAIAECFRNDLYSNSCCISTVSLFFAYLLRAGGESAQFYRYEAGADFSHILHAIRHHYQTVTLSELAEKFHYSKPHLCTLIKQNTGVSFTELLKQIRMSRAGEYLLNTDLPVFEIAEIVGYNSADHFARTFRGVFGVSPQEYRRAHDVDKDRFIPFETQ